MRGTFLVIRYCVWDIYDIRFVVTAFFDFVTSYLWVDKYRKENLIAADKVTAVHVVREDRTSIIREYRKQSCELQAN